MPLKKKPFNEMVRDSLRYLSENTDITYFAQGSIAKALIEANNLEISRLQDFISTVFDNGFLSTASGIYLDLFGEMLGLARIKDRRASATIQDGSCRFYVDAGTLSSKLQTLVSNGKGTIPKGTIVATSNNSIQFVVTEDVTFPLNTRSVFVPITATTSGASFNVGANQLVSHNLGSSEVKVTNDVSITTGSDVEPDNEYRYRLSKAMTTRFSSNNSAIQIVASSQPGVAKAELLPFSRGTGTFDVLLVPQGNRLSNTVKEDTRRAIEQVTAFGISPRVIEPEYVKFNIVVQLRYQNDVSDGQKIGIKSTVESAILRYMGSIPIGGELVINQLRSAIISSSTSVKDIKIVELSIDGHPRVISNIQLGDNELFVPDIECTDSVKVV